MMERDAGDEKYQTKDTILNYYIINNVPNGASRDDNH
jgi:hypothetical protein